MSVVAGDLIVYLSANVPDSDSGTAGGAIDLLRFPDFTQLASNAAIEVVSSNAGDTTQTVTVEARKADGSFVSQGVTLNGTTPVQFGTLSTIERVLTCELSATAAGNVTLRVTSAGATIRVISAGGRGFKAVHRRVASDPGTGITRYAKVFVKNTNATFALLSALIKQSADPAAVITHALDASVNASTSTTDRTTTPDLLSMTLIRLSPKQSGARRQSESGSRLRWLRGTLRFETRIRLLSLARLRKE